MEKFRRDKNGWTWVPIPWLLENVYESCDFGEVSDFESRAHFWSDVIVNKAADAGFMEMAESIMTHGWKQALNIYFDELGAYITNGHHRLVIAILLCHDEVPVLTPGGKRSLPGCPDILTYHDDHDEDSLTLEVL